MQKFDTAVAASYVIKPHVAKELLLICTIVLNNICHIGLLLPPTKICFVMCDQISVGVA
jgi:hypothetical protein